MQALPRLPERNTRSNTLTNKTLTAETETTEGTQFLITEAAAMDGLRTAPVVPDAPEDDRPEDFTPDTRKGRLGSGPRSPTPAPAPPASGRTPR